MVFNIEDLACEDRQIWGGLNVLFKNLDVRLIKNINDNYAFHVN